MSRNGNLRSCPNVRSNGHLISIICAALLIAPLAGCDGFVLPRGFSGFSEFHIVTNEGPLGVGFLEGAVFEATIRKLEDDRYLLTRSVVEENGQGRADCPVDLYSELNPDLPWTQSPSGNCPVLRELEPRFLTDDEAARIRDLFRTVSVGSPPLTACLFPLEPGPIVIVRWDGVSFDDYCCHYLVTPCVSHDDTSRFYEVLFEFAQQP